MFRLLLYIILVSFQLSQSAKAAFISLNSGYEEFATTQMSDNNASSRGIVYQFEIGTQLKHTILTTYLKKGNLDTQVLHDDTEYSFDSEHISYGVKFSFVVGRSNYMNLSYNISHIKNDLSKLNNYNRSGIAKAYNLDETQTSNGFMLGFGRNFYKSRKYSLYGEYNYIDHGSLDASSHVFLLGLRFKANIRI